MTPVSYPGSTDYEHRTLKKTRPVLVCLLLALSFSTTTAQAATITVNSLIDSNPIAVDGNCTLREAIVSANTNASDDCVVGDAAPTVDVIRFDVDGTITLALELPATTEPMTIDGYTAPNASINFDTLATDADLTIVIDAEGASAGLPINSAVTVRGLVLQDYQDNGIEVQSGGGGSIITGNFVGTSADGLSGSGATATEDFGIRVRDGADAVTIGGTDPADRNLVSDNGITGIGLFSDNNTVQGNLIGTDANGTAALPNSVDTLSNRPAIRIQGSAGNQIGGSTAAARNVISGNHGDAMQVLGNSSNTIIEGNYIGVDISGNVALPQERSGILLFTGSGAAAGTSDSVQIIDNVVAAMPEKGIVADGPPFTNILIDGNFVGVGADGTTSLGIGHGSAAAGDDDGSDPEPGIAVAGDATATISNNLILNNAIGVQVEDTSSQLLASSTDNCVVLNDVGMENTTDDSVVDVFENNWWGQPDGPSGSGPGSGDSLTGSGTTDVEPFLTSAPAGCPSYEADLAISKTDSVDPVAAGTQFTYTVTVDNNGPQDALNVQVSDTLPSGTTFVSSSGCSEDPSGVPTCSLGTIAAGGNDSYTITVDVDPSASGTLTNEASVTTDTVDPNAGNDSISESTDVVAEADLGITKVDSTDPVVAGESLTYTIEVTNAGPSDASGVQVSDTLPAGVTLVSTTGCAEDPNGAPTCSLGTIVAGGNDSYTITVDVDPSASGTLTNSASVSSNAFDSNSANDSASETTDVVTEADLGISKADSTDPVIAGESLTYTIEVTNAGPSDASGVQVDDTLPADVTLVSTTGCAEDPNGAPTCSLGTIASGGSGSYTITVDVDPSASGTLNNSASVSSATSDPNGANDSTSEATDVGAEADLAITKADSSDPVIAGESLTYTIEVTNAGPSDASGVQVDDTLPADVTLVSTTGCAEDPNGAPTCSLGTIASGGSGSYTITVDVDPSASGTLNNSASVSSATSDPDDTNDSTSEATDVGAEADLAITKVDSADPVIAGESLTYTIEVTNAGPSDASGVQVSETLPAGVTLVSTTGCAEDPNGAPTCSLGTIVAGGNDSYTITVDVDPSASGTLTNSASVTSNASDSNSANDSVSETTDVVSEADLSISKTDSVDPVSAGAELTYMITVDNIGPSDASSVQVNDTLPADVTLVSTSGCAEDPSAVPTCTLGAIPAGGSAAYTITVDVDSAASGTLNNSASVSSATSDPDDANDSTSEATDVVAEADLTITKVDSADPVSAGTTFTYTIQVENLGPSDASGVQVSDTLPADVTLVSTTGCAEDPNGVPTCTLGDLTLGSSTSYDIEVEVDLAFEGMLNNTASVSSSTTDPNGANDDASESTQVGAASSDLELTISDNAPSPLGAGEQFDVFLNLTNNGPQDNTGVVVSGMLDGLMFVSSGCATSSGDSFTWSVGGLGASQSISCTIRVETMLEQRATITASASGDNDDPQAGNNTDIRGVFGVMLIIPTLGAWGLIALTMLLLMTSGYMLRLRQ